MATDTAPTIRHTVLNGDARLYVEQCGTGPDLLLIAGLGDTVEAWSEQTSGLSDRYRVTTFDNRGTGRSPLPPSGITLERMASDAAAIVRALDIAPANVVGFSAGGVIAQLLALDEPDLVGSLVLNGTFHSFGVREQRTLDGWLTLAEHAGSPRAFLEQFLVDVYTRAAHEDGRVEGWIQEFLDFEHPTSDEVFAAQIASLREHDTRERLGSLAVPVLVIAGAEDPQSPPSMSREIAEAIPASRLEVLPGQAHQPFQEIPAEWNALVDDFLRTAA